MSFDKKLYKDNRANGLRGQYTPPTEHKKSIVEIAAAKGEKERSHKDPSHIVQMGSRMVKVNRESARRFERQENHANKLAELELKKPYSGARLDRRETLRRDRHTARKAKKLEAVAK